MKKPIIITSVLFAVAAVILFTISCSKQKTVQQPNTNQVSSPNSKTANTCNCGSKPNGCSSFNTCAKKFMGTRTSRNFSINWTSEIGCVPPKTPTPSTGTVCYTGNCDEMQIQFNSDFPYCLDCYATPPICLVTTVVCQGTSYSLQFLGDNGVQTININGDPHISIECNPPGGTYVKWEGDFNWTN